MITNLPVKVLDGKLTKIEELQLRVMNLEAILTDLKCELDSLKSEVKAEDLKKLEKLNKYQKVIDTLWLKQSSAV